MGKLLLYCTKNAPYLIHESGDYDCNDMSCSYDCYSVVDRQYFYDEGLSLEEALNGKIVGECDFEVEEIKLNEYDDYNFSHYSGMYFETKTLQEEELCKQSCLTAEELDEYLDLYKEKEVYGYANHIKNLHIFDEPRELNEFHRAKSTDGHSPCWNCKRFGSGCYSCNIKAPKNMMYVFDGEEKKVLVSIRPEDLCKILNGEITIIVKKKVLREMLN